MEVIMANSPASPTAYTGQPSTKYRQGAVRLATDAEVTAGTSKSTAVTPFQMNSVSTGANFASPPALGFGSTTPRPVHGTTIDATTTITATLGAITATNGNFVGTASGTGILLNSPTGTGAAASPVVVNGRSGKATFSSVSIAAGADLTLTLTNSSITGVNTQIIYSLRGATTGSALSIKSVTNSAGSSAIVITNGTGAATSTANIDLVFLVLN
jgi:hypothetical protein